MVHYVVAEIHGKANRFYAMLEKIGFLGLAVFFAMLYRTPFMVQYRVVD